MEVSEIDYGKRTTVFVASTMPFKFVCNMANKNTIIDLVLMGKNLYPAYSSIADNYLNVHIQVAPKSFVKNAIYLTSSLIKSRLLKREIIFFHECCCPFLDIFIKIIKPNGHYFPMVEMINAAKLSVFDFFPKGKIKYFLKVTFLWRWFDVYEAPPLGNSLTFRSDYFLTLKRYPLSIKVHDIQESRLWSQVNKLPPIWTGKKKIIFLCGASLFDTVKVLSILRVIARYAIENGFDCYIKDHPNIEFRLGFDYPGVTVLEPQIAVESIDDVYSLAIGVTSNSLSLFGNRSVSIVNLIDGLSDSDRFIAVNFIKTLPGAENFCFPESMEQMLDILNNMLKVDFKDNLSSII
jgi:hypothetical protein